MKDYQTYLFDLDGTLISTIDLICHCFQFSLKKHLKQEFNREEILLHIGLPLKEQFIHFIRYAGRDSQDFDLNKMANDHMNYQIQIWKDYVRTYDHALEVVKSLKAKGKKIGVVTSRLSATAGLYLEHTGFTPFLDCIITPEATAKPKPYPDPIWAALEKTGGEVGSAVMIGDALFDIQSGYAAGVDTVWVVHEDSPWLETSGIKIDNHIKVRDLEPAQLATITIFDLREFTF